LVRAFDKKGRMKIRSTFLSLLLTPLVAVMPLRAELSAADTGSATTVSEASVPAATIGATTQTSQASALQIRLADAGKAVVEANSSLSSYAIVVTDASGMPVADAAVAIRLPEDGATGFFVDGAHSAVAYTNAEGVAKFPQVNWSSALGSAAIRVTAVKGELHAGAIIEQTIVAHAAAALPGQAQSQAKAQAIQSAPASGATAKTDTPAQPGTPTSVAEVQSGAAPGKTGAAPEPVVTVVNSASSGGSRGGSNKKWIILAAVGAAAGVGIAVALAAKGGVAAVAPSAGLSIGAPSLSVGH
jgi:hypothetical protein